MIDQIFLNAYETVLFWHSFAYVDQFNDLFYFCLADAARNCPPIGADLMDIRRKMF